MVEPIEDKVIILWSSRDREVATNLVFMYARNSLIKCWWRSVTLVIWGPSAQLLSNDCGLQAELAELRSAGVGLLACKACADRYAVSKELEELGCEVAYMGEPLTRWLKEGSAILTF